MLSCYWAYPYLCVEIRLDFHINLWKKITLLLLPNSRISSIYKAGSGPPCTKNIPHLHAELPQFCMYEKHFFRTRTREVILHVHIWRWEFGFEYTDWGFWRSLYEKHTTSTYTRTPILHVRKTRPAYIHNYPNSACTHLAYTRGLGLLCKKKKYQYLNKKRFSIYTRLNMKGTNRCDWLLLGKTHICGRSCMGKYCSVHNARIAKGGGTIPCIGCGLGVKTALALCKECGADCAESRNGGLGSRFLGRSFYAFPP